MTQARFVAQTVLSQTSTLHDSGPIRGADCPVSDKQAESGVAHTVRHKEKNENEVKLGGCGSAQQEEQDRRMTQCEGRRRERERRQE